MYLSRQMTAVIAAVVFLTFAACDPDDAQVLTDTTAAGSSGGGSAASEQLEATPGSIERAFAADAVLRGVGLSAKADDNRVVLEGTVPSEEHKTRALQIATREAGGIPIDNRIRVEAKR